MFMIIKPTNYKNFSLLSREIEEALHKDFVKGFNQKQFEMLCDTFLKNSSHERQVVQAENLTTFLSNRIDYEL